MAKDRIAKGALDGDPGNVPPVPGFARKWRTGQDELGHRYVIVGAL